MTDRPEQIASLRQAGYSFAAIGKALGISRQRAHQLYQGDDPESRPPTMSIDELEAWRGRMRMTAREAERVLRLVPGAWSRMAISERVLPSVALAAALIEEAAAQARADGARGARNGLDRSDCPWSPSDWRGRAWREGYDRR